MTCLLKANEYADLSSDFSISSNGVLDSNPHIVGLFFFSWAVVLVFFLLPCIDGVGLSSVPLFCHVQGCLLNLIPNLGPESSRDDGVEISERAAHCLYELLIWYLSIVYTKGTKKSCFFLVLKKKKKNVVFFCQCCFFWYLVFLVFCLQTAFLACLLIYNSNFTSN
jgi:hypothetical protein